MKRKNQRILIGAVLLLVLGILFLQSIPGNKELAPASEKGELNLTSEEANYIKEHQNLKVLVGEELYYLTEGDGEGGLLQEYLIALLEPLGMSPVLVTTGEGDAILSAVPSSQSRQGGMRFTTPLFEADMGIFIRQKAQEGEPWPDQEDLKGIYVRGTVSVEQLKGYQYKGRDIVWRQAASTREALKAAQEHAASFLAGNEGAIQQALWAEAERSGEDIAGPLDYEKIGDTVSTQSICLGVPEGEETLYRILNQAVYLGDAQKLSSLQGKWYGLSRTLESGNAGADFGSMALVIVAAILCLFFIYYIATENLFDELTNRMEQLHASQREMEAVFNAVSHFMAEVDGEGRILNINRSFCDFLGKSASQMTEKDVVGLFSLTEELEQRLRGLIRETAARGSRKLLNLRSGRRFYEIHTFPMEELGGHENAVLFMAMDVTELKTAEKQMLQNSKMIAVGQLAAGVAHEIRNPLGVIRNYCYLLRASLGTDPEMESAAFSAIEKSLDKSNGIITNLLNFSRESPGRVEEIDLRQRIASVISFQEGRFKSQNIQISIDCPEGLRMQVLAESLEMVLVNLISNAADAVSEGGKIEIFCRRDEGDVIIKVKDDGVGIPQEILEEIYNPFFTTKLHEGGTGLGLYIVYNEVQKMDAAIAVESGTGQGTTFTVTIPG